ncbi:glycosyltransferase family 4 protein [Pseudomonas sp. S9]|uniref:glycosyltransferase family 4 protein n=1 Tax=Pseudomonas sp. S9 TaxID=686578 RepID=UPI000255743E|nr:glycosyltransferase family 1 protein [Pseudomonas sp. S9]
MRLLVECTYVFEHPNDNSGIQRVVRNVIKQLASVDSGVECIPVMMQAGEVHQVFSLAPLPTRELSWMQNLRVRLEHWRNRFWFLHARLERHAPLRYSHALRRLFYVLCRLAGLSFSIPIRLLDRFIDDTPAPERAVVLECREGDQLLLLDSSWHADFFPLAERLKREGVGIISVIYDLIPLTHPQFCDAGLVKVFDRWFDWISQTADGFIAISSTISEQVRAEVGRRIGQAKAQSRWFDHFHLGSELDLVVPGKKLDPELLGLFAKDAPVYLMVSTIEPRKNHAYLLDAFELLWQKGSPACLCIIGKVGLKCDALIERIESHPELNRRLFMFNGLDDAGLEYAYSHSRALVFPSYVEGFGLPLVEAMQRGLPAMASAIPVFEEIGGDFMAYFQLDQPASLAALVETFEQQGRFPAAQDLQQWSWLSWSDSTRQWVARTAAHIGQARSVDRSEREFDAKTHSA